MKSSKTRKSGQNQTHIKHKLEIKVAVTFDGEAMVRFKAKTVTKERAVSTVPSANLRPEALSVK